MSLGRRIDRELTWLKPHAVTEDTSGGRRGDWIEDGRAPVGLRPVSARERFAAGAVQAPTEHVAEVRYRSDITTDYRVQIDARVFEILAVREMGRRRALELDLIEIRS